MKPSLINAQLSNNATFNMYLRQMITLAENVFEFKDMPEYIDIPYLNSVLLEQGSIAFFKDDVLGLLALPYVCVGELDVYDRPLNIRVLGSNGYNRYLKPDEYVIMYDNNGRYSIVGDIMQYASRIALDTRTIDCNIAQQKNMRLWQVPHGQEKTIKDLVNNVDGFESTIITYDNMSIDNIHVDLIAPPYIVDKLDMHKEKDWNEFLRLIGISNMNFQKKERNIKDEVIASQGGTIASRFSRFEPRDKAIKMINQKFGTDIKVQFYDGLLTSLDNGGDLDDITNVDATDTSMEY